MKNPIRDELSFEEALQMLSLGRGVVAEMLELALKHGDIESGETRAASACVG